MLHGVTLWLERQTPNAFSAGALGGVVCVCVAVIVSKLTTPLPEEHLGEVFG